MTCTYIPAHFKWQKKIFSCKKRYLTQLVIIFGFFLFYFYFCVFTRVQLEFNSFLTNDPRSAKIADDPSTSGNPVSLNYGDDRSPEFAFFYRMDLFIN